MYHSKFNRRLAAGVLLLAASLSSAAAQDYHDGDEPDVARTIAATFAAPFTDDTGFIAAPFGAEPNLTPIEWQSFSERLTEALSSGHTGLQHDALRLIIAYNESLTFDSGAILDVMRLYRNGEKDATRRMAVVALASMKSDFAMSYLERAVRFEKSHPVRHTMLAVLADASRTAAL